MISFGFQGRDDCFVRSGDIILFKGQIELIGPWIRNLPEPLRSAVTEAVMGRVKMYREMLQPFQDVEHQRVTNDSGHDISS